MVSEGVEERVLSQNDTFTTPQSGPYSLFTSGLSSTGEDVGGGGQEYVGEAGYSSGKRRLAGLLQQDLPRPKGLVGGLRPVIDLSAFNEFLVAPYCRMETAETIRMVLQRNSCVISLDLKDAYFCVPISPSFRKYLCSHWQGVTYQFRALPFGISPAPWFFTIIVEGVQVMVQTRSFTLHQYLDDWILRASSARDLLATKG